MHEQRVRAPVFSLLLLSGLAACTGPGLEPPGEDRGGGSGIVGGAGGGVAGSFSPGGGSGGAGGAGGDFGNAGSSGGTGVVGGMAGSGVGGFGGTGAAGTGGAVLDPDGGDILTDGGVELPTAPAMECETGRDVVELSAGEDAGAATCELLLPEAARPEAESSLTVALTDAMATQMPPRVLSVLGCLLQGGQGFYYQLDAQGQPERIVLCEASCALAEAGATIELLYGCPTPLP